MVARKRVEASKHEAEMFQCGAGFRSTIPPSYRTYIFPNIATFLHLLFGRAIDDGYQRLGRVDKMAASLRVGSSMLSRVASPSTCLAKRTFTTSIAFRLGPKIPTGDETPPAVAPLARSNPLIGSVPPSPPRAETAPTETASAESKPTTHAYDASKPFSLDIASIIANKSSAFGAEISSDPISRPQIRAKAVTGRTVFVRDAAVTKTSGPTPMVALRVLNRIVREDQVKNKYHSQKFHERKGLKKKRLKSQRWRARFKHGFKATVSRVMELKKQGW
ncbi:ribosomal s21 [Fusarium beomiforme]|uniref:Ribosomal s21 n=1 Tax=Fusarium beomiforme TaxID=44412 RepID=A0A9P5DZK2_9HYPO|nr:ribosomal s21 [Fusarium beomiforme]